MNTRYPLILSLMLSGGAVAGQQVNNQLKHGIGVTTDNFSQLVSISTELSVARSVHRSIDAGFVNGFVTNDDDSIIYSLSRGPALHAGNMETRAHLGSWPLTRWPYLSVPETVLSAIQSLGVDASFRDAVQYTSHRQYAGCLDATPLRHGDIEGNGDNELVLFLDGELLAFSPDKGAVIFAMFYDLPDWLRGEEAAGIDEIEAIDGERYPFISETYYANSLAYYATRTYSKLFQGDFNDDDQPDILVWRKVYRANAVGEPTGFALAEDTLAHYTRLDAEALRAVGGDPADAGSYLPQPTDNATVRSWLAANNLTWQSGFPSKSECPGSEGELIPEMHDPLLNDPEVLQ